MGFRDYPFVASGRPDRDSRRFPGHQEVLRYLEDFSQGFKLNELIRFQTEVSLVGLEEDGRWKVRSETNGADGQGVLDEKYDAVVVCNGHYTEPRLAEIPGIEKWPGRQIHSHNYRVPDDYRDQVVVLIGSSANAVDISRGVVLVAKEVHIAARSSPEGSYGQLPTRKNMWLHPMVQVSLPVPTKGAVTVDDNRVGPLYEHVFPPALSPWLSFVGLLWKVAPFPLVEFQSKWIAGVLSGRPALPSQEEMMKEVEELYASMEAAGIPKRYTHKLDACQFEYNDGLAAKCGCAPTEEWRKQMYVATSMNKRARPKAYHDEWDDDHLVLLAQKDFSKYI